MATHYISNATQLQAALGKAVGGDKLILAAGDYGSVNIYNRNYASNVTIQTQSFTDRAHFDGLFLSKSKNLTFVGLDIGRAVRSDEDPDWTHLSYLRDSSNIRLNGIKFHGSLDDNPQNDGTGLVVSRVNNFRLDYSSFEDLFRGVALQQSTGVTVANNSFETIRSDGITMAAMTNAMVNNNSFQDFRPILGDHADGIQVWNTSQPRGSDGVTIKNNVMWFPEIAGTPHLGVQGIWVSDPLTYGFKNFRIENNLIYSNDAWNGIGVRGATGLQVVGNTLLSTSKDEKYMWIRLEDSSSVTMKNNVSDELVLKNVSGLYQSNNVVLADQPALRGLIANLDTPTSVHDLIFPGNGFQLPGVTTKLNFDGSITSDGATVAAPSVDLDTVQNDAADDVGEVLAPDLWSPVAAVEPQPVVMEPAFTASTDWSMAFRTDYFVALP